jgi:DNA modification methylase
VTPYYDDGQCVIYHGDCREIAPRLKGIGVVVTDPPYPDYHVQEYGSCDLRFLDAIHCRQFVFWTTRVDFPLSWQARHVWDKRKGGAGSAYEFIYERNGSSEQWVWPFVSIQNEVRAQFSREVFTGHKSQKPWRLIARIIRLTTDGVIVDPFMGSGSTLVAAKAMSRRAIGIEVQERWCDVAAQRLQQGSLFVAGDDVLPSDGVQESLL